MNRRYHDDSIMNSAKIEHLNPFLASDACSVEYTHPSFFMIFPIFLKNPKFSPEIPKIQKISLSSFASNCNGGIFQLTFIKV